MYFQQVHSKFASDNNNNKVILANSVWPKSIEPRFDEFIGNIIILYKIFLEMVGFQLSEEDIRHLTEEVTDAKGELSKNDFILHVKVTFCWNYVDCGDNVGGGGLGKWKKNWCLTTNFLQKTNMFSQFESVDPESDHHWNEKVNNWLKEFQVQNWSSYFYWQLQISSFLANLKKVQVKKAWTLFDKNGDGKLTPQEFRCIFLELGKKK